MDQLYRTVLQRRGSAAETTHWADRLVSGQLSAPGLINAFAVSREYQRLSAGREQKGPPKRLLAVSDPEFVAIAFERVFGFVPNPRERLRLEHQLRTLTRAELLASIFESWGANAVDSPTSTHVVDPSRLLVMGTDTVVDTAAWSQDHPTPVAALPVRPRTYASLCVRRDDGVVASVITSLYGGADHIEKFLQHITAQTILDQCEVIIVDAASPDGELETIQPYLDRFPSLRYHRTPTRIGIYEAWNVGVAMARGRYLTNANVDDLRRPDSLERQAEVLDTLGFVDVVYQDFYYSFDPQATFDQVAAGGLRSSSPVITPQNLVEHNYPHNAPMWRAALHDELGPFNEGYTSAGDAEFWWRALGAGKTFYKLNDPHVGYFLNPRGVSTAPDTRGLVEWRTLRSTWGPSLASDWLQLDRQGFAARLAEHLPGVSLPDAKGWDWRSRSIEALLMDLSASSRTAGQP